MSKLYRAVSEAEFQQLMSTGDFQTVPHSLCGKFFAESAADAQRWGQALGGPFRVVEAEIPDTAARRLMRWEMLDGIGPARYAELDDLVEAVIREVT